MLSKSEMEKAVLTRDSTFDGQFYYGVITTGVFCVPSCPSKAANPENIRFFEKSTDAMASGFRPCKRCNPAQQGKGIDHLIQVARYIENNLDEKLTLDTLAEVAQLSPSQLQKRFKASFGLSPKQYQDAIRMQSFKDSLSAGNSVTEAVYDSGFSSSSRVYGEASRQMGMTPKAYKDGGKGEVIHYACRPTDLGLIMMAATEKGVCSVQFGDEEGELFSQLSKEFPHADIRLSAAQDSLALDNWIEALDAHIHQGAPKPDIPLDIRGTAFQVTVWNFLMSIKEGQVMSYGEVAEKIGKEKAVRAVGTACGKNTIGYLIPCHRVLRSDGSLGGYRWGLERKRALLDQEKQKGKKTAIN
ncbi:bifunctional transcriptional activator/DNA repair enzyme AdaA [Marinomonas sargassi]|nr:methylated-DNA--[protein]-cysteine S-methyltransferase [Marinomonas sargassi]